MSFATIQDFRDAVSASRLNAMLTGSATLADGEVNRWLWAAANKINAAAKVGGYTTPLVPDDLAPPTVLTGVVSIVAGEVDITGVGTTFLADYKLGRSVRIDGQVRELTAVSDDLTALVDLPWTKTAAGVGHEVDVELSHGIEQNLMQCAITLALEHRLQQPDEEKREREAITACKAFLDDLRAGTAFPVEPQADSAARAYFVTPPGDLPLSALAVNRGWTVRL